MRDLNAWDWIALILLIIGGLNWGIVGLFDYNVIDAIFKNAMAIARIIYVLVGLSAIYYAILAPNLGKK